MVASSGSLDRLHRFVASSGGRLYVGSCPGGGLALADPEHAVLVLGPPRAGKTTALAIPNVLAAPGAVLATSTKLDVLAATVAARSREGRSWLFDPSGTVRTPEGVNRLRWSPVSSAATWDEALVLARVMTAAGRPHGHLGEAAHWTERAEALLAPLLHAAHLAGHEMDSVVRWVLRQELEPAKAVLLANGLDLAADVLGGIDATDPREQSGIWSSAAGTLAAYRSDAALDSSAACNFDPLRLAAGTDTVYVCGPARHQQLTAPIVVAFVEQARAGAYASGAPIPLTVVLDEAANIAPLPDLPALVSEAGGQGLAVMAFFQDLSQARTRWGPAAEGFLSLFGTKLILPGIGDLATLELVSRLGGEVDIPACSVSRGPWWGPSRGAATHTWSHRRQRRLPVEAVSQQPPGRALILASARPPQQVWLPPWWAIPEFRAAPPIRAIEPRSL